MPEYIAHIYVLKFYDIYLHKIILIPQTDVDGMYHLLRTCLPAESLVGKEALLIILNFQSWQPTGTDEGMMRQPRER